MYRMIFAEILAGNILTQEQCSGVAVCFGSYRDCNQTEKKRRRKDGKNKEMEQKEDTQTHVRALTQKFERNSAQHQI